MLSTSRSRAEEVMGKLTTTFDHAGLLTHSVSVSDSQLSPLGQFWTVNVVGAPWLCGVFESYEGGIDAILKAKTVTDATQKCGARDDRL